MNREVEMSVVSRDPIITRPKEKRQRIGTGKVKTGCATCKKRHIKCDETKPSCQRCTKFGLQCDGYEVKAIVVIRKPVQRDLLPKISNALETHTLNSSSTIPSLILCNPRSYQEDVQYFQYFRRESVNELSGGWDEPLWNIHLLQACHEMPFIHNMALTLAAQGRFERLKREARSTETADALKVYAMKKYSKSLAEIRQYLSSTRDPDVRMILLASLLIFVFEFKQGNMEAAVKQIRSTLTLFKSMRLIESVVCTSSHDVRCPETLEEAIVDMIARLDKQGFLLQVGQSGKNDENNTNITVLGMVHHSPDRTDVPTDFPNVFIARRFISLIQYFGRPNFASDAIKYILKYLSKIKGKAVDEQYLGRVVSVREFSDRFLETQQWLSSFDKLHRRLHFSRTSDYRSALSVKIQALASLLVMGCEIGFQLESSPNIALEEICNQFGSVRGLCEEILSLGRMTVDDPGFLRCYVFDFGIIICILVILFATDDLDLEQKTLGILRDMRPRREGVWDSCAVTEMAEAIILSRSSSIRIL